MKTTHRSYRSIHQWVHSRLAGLWPVVALALTAGWLPQAAAQSDNFNDGNDTSPPPAWVHYDPIGGLTAPPAAFTFPSGGYRIYAPAPLAPDAGPARAGTFLTNANYDDSFYVSVDVIDFDDTVRQAFGVVARVSTPGLGTTAGYLFSWEPGGGSLPGTSNGDLDISPLIGEQPIGQIEIGNSALHLTKGKSYRFVFMGRGFDFEGQVYELPDTTNALIRLPAHDDAALYTNGFVGLIAASQSSLAVPGDATFDNFYASDHDPRGRCDGFNDGNDTSPEPAWVHYDPLGGLTAAPASFLFTNGGYRIYSPAPLAPDAGPARAGAFLTNADYLDFYVSADIIDFDDTVRQAFGIAARVTTPGLGTTGGYLFSWEPGGGSLPGTSNGDLDISVLVGELPIDQIETAPSGLHLTRGKSYRFVFLGKGSDFEGQVYELPDTTNPLIRLPAHDPDRFYTNGIVGLITASQSAYDVPGDATFDNFVALSLEPRLEVSRTGANVTLTWPALASYVLQRSPSLLSPVWTDVTTGITHQGRLNVFPVPVGTGAEFYRLNCVCH